MKSRSLISLLGMTTLVAAAQTVRISAVAEDAEAPRRLAGSPRLGEPGQIAAGRAASSKYTPHQGDREKARRMKRAALKGRA